MMSSAISRGSVLALRALRISTLGMTTCSASPQVGTTPLFVAFPSAGTPPRIRGMWTGDGTWREIMERADRLLAELGPRVHPSYREGWERLALSHDRIPTIDEINERLAPTR